MDVLKATFSQKERRIDGVHLKKKTHKCETCPYESCNKGHIKVHNILVHDKLREHVCLQFIAAANLTANI